MDAKRGSEPTPMKMQTGVERKSERELAVTRTFNAPARIVFEAWTTPDLLKPSLDRARHAAAIMGNSLRFDSWDRRHSRASCADHPQLSVATFCFRDPYVAAAISASTTARKSFGSGTSAAA